MIALVTCFHGRPKVSRLFFAGVERLKREGHQVQVCAAVTKGDHENLALCEEHGAAWVEHSNHDLALKFNAAAAIARWFGADAIMTLGSDDLVSGELLTEARELIPRRHYIVPGALGVYAPHLKKAALLKDPVVPNALKFGAGRILSFDLLERLSWKPWPAVSASRGLAVLSHLNILKAYPSIHVTDNRKHHVLDVKSPENIWGFDHLRKQGSTITKEEALWFLSDQEKALM